MSLDRKKALALLDAGRTCAIIAQGKLLQSTRRGVAPLVEWVQAEENCRGGFAADKVVGKAAAYLYVLLKVQSVYARVMSEAAEDVFVRFGIAYEYESKVPAIRNRDGTGFCPMEQAVWNTDEPETAYERIIKRMEELRK